MIFETPLTITTTGAAGSAAGNATTTELPNGLLVAVFIPAGMPATADWTFTYENPTTITLFTLTNFQSGWFTPLIPGRDLTGAAITGSGVVFPVNRQIKVAIAQGDAATITLRFLIQRN